MKKNIHWWIYGVGLFISVVCIGLSFINMCQDGKNVLCGIGASGIGAVFLSFAIEWSNEVRRFKQNKIIFQTASQDIFQNLYFLLIVINRIIRAINKVFNVDNDKFDNISIEKLIPLYVKDIENIKSNTAPILCTGESISKEDMDGRRLQAKGEKLLFSYNQEIDKYREIFDSLKERFDTTKAILLANNICDRGQATKLQTVLAVLSSHGCLTHGASLIEMGRSLDELVRCELIPVINEIGFTNIRFTNKNGYLETTWVNSK